MSRPEACGALQLSTQQATRSGPAIRLMIVSDCRFAGESLAIALAASGSFSVVEVVDFLDGVWERVEIHVPEVVLLDIPFQAAVELTPRLVSHASNIKVIPLRVEESSELIGYIEAGASGFVLQSSSLGDLAFAIENVSRGETVCSPRLAYWAFSRLAELAGRRRHRRLLETRLTLRELEIVDLIAVELTNEEIAARLCLSVHTVRNHVHKIMAKLEVRNRSEAALYLAHPPDLRQNTSNFLKGPEKVEVFPRAENAECKPAHISG